MQERKEINVEVGQRIKAAREQAGLTQERFSELIGLGTKSVSALERGTVGVSLTTLKRICEVLAISSDALLFGVSAPDDAAALAKRFAKLSPAQYRIALDMFENLMAAFSLSENHAE